MPTDRRAARVFEVLARRQPDLTVLAEDVHKPHNLSAMLRSCDAVGIGTVHAVRPTGGVPTYQATSASAEKWATCRGRCGGSSLRSTAATWGLGGVQILAAHTLGRRCRTTVRRRTSPPHRDPVRQRVPLRAKSARAAARADAHVVIPMLGMEADSAERHPTRGRDPVRTRSGMRREPGSLGLPDCPPGPAECATTRAYRWLYPQQAERLALRGEPAPWLDEDGDLWRGPGDAPPWARRTPPPPETPATAGSDDDAGA